MGEGCHEKGVKEKEASRQRGGARMVCFKKGCQEKRMTRERAFKRKMYMYGNVNKVETHNCLGTQVVWLGFCGLSLFSIGFSVFEPSGFARALLI